MRKLISMAERDFREERLKRCREKRNSCAVQGGITTFYDEWIINEMRDLYGYQKEYPEYNGRYG